MFMEYMWIVVSLIALGFAIHAVVNSDLKNGLTFFGLTILSIIIFIWRRRLRKNQE